MFLCKEFKFDAAHNLVNYHGKCERLHGHTYRFTVTLEGDPDDEGMVADFAEVKSVVKDMVLSKLDHSYLNDVIEQPTAEYISQWIFRILDGPLKRINCSLYEVRVWETENSSIICRREDI